MPGQHMRYLPWQPLEEYLAVNYPDPNAYRTSVNLEGLSVEWVAQLLRVNRNTIYRHRQNERVLERTADRYAVELGLHPTWIWGDDWLTSISRERERACA